MIKIIKDLSKKYQTINEHFEVINFESYFKAREYFINNYKKKINFEIIIKNKNYFPFFLDFENYRNINIEEIKKVQEPDITLGSCENIFNFLLNYQSLLRDNKKNLKLLEKKYLQNYKFLFKEKDQNINNIIETLVKIVVFSNYKECNFNILLDSNFTEEMYKIAKSDIKLKESFKKANLFSYIKKCNEILMKNSRKIQLFNEIPTEKYLYEINGTLPFEEDFFIKTTVERLNLLNNYQDIKKNILKAEKIFNKEYVDIINLIDNIILLEISRKKEKKTIDEFTDYFYDIYLNYNNISLDKSIENHINKIEKKYKADLLSLKKSIKNIWLESNKLFENFYLKNYNNLYSSFERKGLDYAIENSLSSLNNNKKNLYIFIDCLRYDIWLGIKKYMQKKGWNCHLDKIILSAIPTVTSYCKKILYTGKKFPQIESSDYFKFEIKNLTNISEINTSFNNKRG